jgi:hypothetical protein
MWIRIRKDGFQRKKEPDIDEPGRKEERVKNSQVVFAV